LKLKVVREKSQDGSSPLSDKSAMQVFVSSQEACATVSLPDLSMSFAVPDLVFLRGFWIGGAIGIFEYYYLFRDCRKVIEQK
jgi:hypothetical protein